MAVEPIAETYADHNSYGFRRSRSTADAIERCFNVLSRPDAPEWILEGDVKGRYATRRYCYSPHTKGNFEFERVLKGWRSSVSVVDLRLKR